MKIGLHTPARKVFACLVCMFLAASYLFIAARSYLAYRSSLIMQSTPLERAIALEPGNADYRAAHGAYCYFIEQNYGCAVEEFENAAKLNPTVARYWLNLAMAELTTGNVDRQGVALNQAVAADPTTPEIAWEAANYYLVQGDMSRAMGLFRVVLEYDDTKSEQALQVCWRAVGNADRIINEAIPPRSDRYLSFLQLLVSNRDVDSSQRVWARLSSLHKPVPPKSIFPFLDLLIESGHPNEADEAWRQLAKLDPALESYLPNQNLIVNGEFEQDILNGGFDWRYVNTPNVSLSVDTNTVHNGGRSLSLAFDGGSGPIGVSQVVVVRPDTEYSFSASYTTERLATASGPRFVIVDPSDQTVLLSTDEMLGAASWREVQGSFKTGPATRVVVINLTRVPSNLLIKGRLMIDDVALVQK